MDTKENHADLRAFIDALGIEYGAEFVPFSRSRNAKEKVPSLNWIVTVKRGRQSLTTDYMQGCGHIPHYSHQFSRLVVYDTAVRDACETGKSRIIEHKNGYDAVQGYRAFVRFETIPAPSLLDVLYALTLDADALNYPTFEEWARDMGYEVDSRAAEKTYRACLEVGLKLRAMLGDENLAKLRELFSDY